MFEFLRAWATNAALERIVAAAPRIDAFVAEQQAKGRNLRANAEADANALGTSQNRRDYLRVKAAVLAWWVNALDSLPSAVKGK